MLSNPKVPAEWITFTEEILNGKLHCLWIEIYDLIKLQN